MESGFQSLRGLRGNITYPYTKFQQNPSPNETTLLTGEWPNALNLARTFQRDRPIRGTVIDD